MKLPHWLKHNWLPWSEPVQQGMRRFSDYEINFGAEHMPPDKPDYYRWVQERKCSVCNKTQRQVVVTEEL